MAANPTGPAAGGGSAGEMRRRIEAFDWAATPLGPAEAWPQSLKTAVALMLDSAQPAYVAWGPELTSLYNDGYIGIAGAKHPGALGQPCRTMWAEVWDDYGPMIAAMRAGESRHFVDQPVPLLGRAGRPMSWFTFSCTPLRDESGAVAGFYCATSETTDRVLAERSREHLYRALVESMDQAVSIIDVEFDASGACVDYRVVETNPAFVAQTGLVDAEGKRARELVPELEPFWFERFGRVARTGEPARFEHHVEAMGRWYGVASFPAGPPGSHRVANVFEDITARVEGERRLREGAARQAFLLRLGDALRAEPDADRVMDRALGMLCEHLRLDRAFVVDYDVANDVARVGHQVGSARVAPLPAALRLSDHPQAFAIVRNGTLVVEDDFVGDERSAGVAHDPRGLGLRALVASTLRQGRGHPLWSMVAACAEPRRWSSEDVALVEDVAERTWAAAQRARADAALRESEERLRLGTEVAKFALWDWNIRTGEVTWSDQHFRLQGYAVGEVAPSYAAWAARVHPEDLPGTEAALEHARDTRTEFVREFRTRHPDGSVHWMSARGRFFEDAEGAPARMVGAMVDVTEARAWSDRQAVLVAELQHRTRNLMGVVRAVFERTRRDCPDVATLGAAYLDRLNALARVQGLLSRLDEGDRLSFDELIQAELSAMGAVDADGHGERVVLEGPSGIRMRSGSVQTLALALHELATNAQKYGALRQPEGHLTVRWSLREGPPEPRVRIEWIEQGVTMARDTGPLRMGYGRELIEQALPYQLQAHTRYRLTEDGVRCVIELPASAHGNGDADA